MKRQIDVCLTPELVHLQPLDEKLVVVVDIFRATSCMVAGLSTGVRSIVPVATVEECLSFREKGYLCAGERGGEKIPEFDIGNSPFEYMGEKAKDRDIAVSTTNGTLAISRSADASEIIIAGFLNLSATVSYLKNSSKNVVVHCAGWKGTFNLEDTTFAGALIELLQDSHEYNTDAAFMARSLWQQGNGDLYTFLLKSAHAKRLQKFGIEKDLEYCCKTDEFDKVIAYNKGQLSIH
ncbi:MAG: 2-phosphosulfolactate phosphatase [Cyclobacteriaceae bacterium]